MKYVQMVLMDRAGFSKKMADDFVGLSTTFIDEKQAEHKAKVEKAKYISQEGIYLTLSVPDEASIESITANSLLGVSLD